MSLLEYFFLAKGTLIVVVVLVVAVVDLCLGFVLLVFNAGVIGVTSFGVETVLGWKTDLDLSEDLGGAESVAGLVEVILGGDVICFLTGEGFVRKTGGWGA